jgi:hypothetical protein
VTTSAPEIEPWRELPPSLAALIEAELPATTDEILAAIGREVPEYARPLEGSFGRGIRTGVDEALRQFVELVRDPDRDRGQSREVYRALGRGELRQGRTLDSLQSAYRVGARVAWRRLAQASRTAGIEPDTLSVLAEAIFAYIDRLAADSVEGYAEAMAEREDERGRRRRALVELLLRDPAPERAEVEAAARAANWRLPRSVAALACDDEDLTTLLRRLPPDGLVSDVDATGCIVLPDPEGPGRREELSRAAKGTSATLGPAVPAEELRHSWQLARAALSAVRSGRIRGEPPIRAAGHLGDLLVFGAGPVLREVERSRLAGLDDLAPGLRRRMEETGLAYLQNGGNAAAVARQLHLHPQSVRHRLRRLRDLLGEQLDDPAARFELEAALRNRLAASLVSRDFAAS